MKSEFATNFQNVAELFYSLSIFFSFSVFQGIKIFHSATAFV